MDNRTCSAPDCDRRAVYTTLMLCKRCYNRARQAPNPHRVSKLATNVERFWRHVTKSEDGCWVWGGRINNSGYGRINLQGRVVEFAHRWSYEHFIGPIPEGLQIDHLCMNKPCVNPSHLEPVTGDENMARYSASITTCINGHEYTEANTYYRPDGNRRQRQCRICRREAGRRSQARRRAA